jgi:hypothetical protein
MEQNCPLGSRVPKRPKHPRLYVLSHFSISPIGISGLARTGKLTLVSSGYRNAEMPIQFTLCLIGISQVGTSRYKRMKSHILRFPEYRKADTPTRLTLDQNLGFRGSEIREVRRQEVSHLDLLGAETLKYQLLTCASISGFHPSEFRGSGIRDLRVQGTTPLGIPGTETPKSYNFIHIIVIWDFAIRVSGLTSTGNTRT